CRVCCRRCRGRRAPRIPDWLRTALRRRAATDRRAPRRARCLVRGCRLASIDHDGADRLALLHQLEAVVDALERERVGDEVVDVDLLLHVPIDDLGHIAAASGAAEGRALPDAAGYELKRPRRNLLAGAGDANDGRDAPALVAALERLTHQRRVADAFEAVI